MSSVLVGMFDSHAAAATARDDLIAAGFPSSAVSLTAGGDTNGAYSSTSPAASEPQHGNAFTRFFENLFGSGDHDDAERANYQSTYQEAFNRGSVSVSVTTADDAEADRAEAIMNRAGAVDIDESAKSWRAEGWTGGTAVGTGQAIAAGETQKLQELQEELVVGKRTVARGGVRIFSRLTEVPVSETVSLREEHAEVRRTAVDRPATEADFAAFKEGSVEVRESAEEAVVTKTAHVTGEVEVGKTATEREETISDTVRKTEVDVEQIGTGMTSAREATMPLTGTSTTTPLRDKVSGSAVPGEDFETLDPAAGSRDSRNPGV